MAQLRISVFESKELQTVLFALKAVPKEIRKQIRQQTKAMIDPVWRGALAEGAGDRFESRALATTARVAVSDQNVMLKSAGVGRALAGGLKPSEIWPWAEFGGTREKTRTYTATSRKGRTYTVRNRHTTRQLRPYKRSGYVVFPAAARIIPRIAALWTQTVVRTVHDALEGKSN